MNLAQIDHIAITCRSVEASARWYQDVLGFKHIFEGKWDGVPMFLQLGSTAIALFPAADANTSDATRRAPHINHFAMLAATSHAFLEAQVELKERGIDFNTQDHEVSHSIYFKDPDGHQLEITTYDVK